MKEYKEGIGRIDLSDLDDRHYKQQACTYCVQCKEELVDLLSLFVTPYNICGKCVRKNHRQATRRR